MPEIVIGKVTEFFAHPVVAGIELSAPLKVGDRIVSRGIPLIWSLPSSQCRLTMQTLTRLTQETISGLKSATGSDEGT